MDNIKNLEGMGKTSAVLAQGAADDVIVQYTSHPIMNYAVGDFQFTNGLLSLKSQEEVDEFESVLNDKKFPPQERNRIRKIDVEAAHRIAQASIDAQRTVTQNTDSSLGARGVNDSKTGKTSLVSDPLGGGTQDPALIPGNKVPEQVVAVDSEGKPVEKAPAGLAGLLNRA